MQAQRPFQVVVWGATGFTGKLVCEHIARDYQGRIRWAMAGRDARKLQAVKEELAKINPAVKDVPIITADAMDSAALGSMMSQTQVVLALAGPFAKYGSNVVAQAVEQGTHYCDITGEINWVKKMYKAHNAAAVSKGVKLVHCCGFDSVPSDLGALLLVDHCKKVLGKNVAKVYSLVGTGSFGVSGGTIASAMNIAATETTSELTAIGTDIYYLAEATGEKRGTAKPAPFLPTYLPEPGVWAGPFIMEGTNSRIVMLSNALEPKGPYGKDFKFIEMTQTGTGLAGMAKAAVVSFSTALIGAAFMLGPLRALLARFLPAPGEGPSLEARTKGFWLNRVVAVTEEAPGVAPTIVEGIVGDSRDPGYWSTSRMLLETGLALALDADKIAASGECRESGVLTPATAAGMCLVDRLRKAGFKWEVKGAGTKVAPAPAAAPVTSAQ